MADYAPVQETLAPAAGPPIDPDVLEQRRKLARALIAQAMGGEPIGSWTQGVAKLAQALMGGYTVRKTNEQEAAGRASGAADTAAALEAIMAGGGGGGDGGGETADEPGTEPVSSAPTSDVEAYIRQSASKRGIDPNVAVRVARSEGLAPGVWQSNVRRNGQRETSYGPYQLLVGGGLGDKFIRQTGLNPRDPSTVKAQVDFALDQARQGGWSPWYGAGKVGIGNWTGIRRGGGGETAALPNVDPVGSAPSPDVAQFLGQTPSQQPPSSADRQALLRQVLAGASESPADVAADVRKYYANEPPEPQNGATLPGVAPMAAMPSPDVMAFLGRSNKQQYPVDPQSLDMKVGPDFLATQPTQAGLSIGDGTVARVPQPRPNTASVTDLPIPPEPPLPRPRPEPPTELPYASGADPRAPQPRPDPRMLSGILPAMPPGRPLPPVQPVARQPQPRPTTPLDPAAGQPAPAATAAPATTASIPQPQRRAPIFREPYPSVLSAQEFARQGQNYLTGRPSFPDQQAAAPAQPRRGLLQALLGRGGPQAPPAAQAAPAGSPVAAGATAAPTAAPAATPASSRITALLANPYVSDTVRAAVLARLMPKQQEPFTLGPGEKRFAPGGGVIAEGGPEPRKIQGDSNGVPRYVDTGEPVFGSDTTGGKPPVKITDVTTMRKEIQDLPGVKAYKLAIPSQNSMAENFNKNTRASDLDFIYAMAKIFDPTSVVREAEQVAVKNSQGLPDQVVGYINAVNGGATLSPETRRALWETTGGRMKQYREAVDAELSPFPGIAGRWGIDPRDIMPELVEMKDLPPVDKSTAPPIIHE